MKLTNSSLHYVIMEHFVKSGRPPKCAELALTFNVSQEEIFNALEALQEYHGVVLHPVSHEVWVMHPFSAAPTHFWLESKSGQWWGNCAWCALGAAAILNQDLTITTTIGGQSKQIKIDIVDGEIKNKNLYVHFPIPMINAWDNVTFTCSVMLMFESEQQIDLWCEQHGFAKGDVQPIEKIWSFAQVWYGKHLDKAWTKWSVEEAKAIFEQFDLKNTIWSLPESKTRF
ncbi:PUTATIVE TRANSMEMBRANE PROTEIN [Pseudoalteromonas luteoviolacea B = ATCC 29581]|nr:PUTATIVE TRANSMEMBRANE PROTEIN [Pseudoalteromonas luteoviolacea B = ATCC 29581]